MGWTGWIALGVLGAFLLLLVAGELRAGLRVREHRGPACCGAAAARALPLWCPLPVWVCRRCDASWGGWGYVVYRLHGLSQRFDGRDAFLYLEPAGLRAYLWALWGWLVWLLGLVPLEEE